MTPETARIDRLAHGGEGDPFGFFGMHCSPDGGLVVRAIRPNADSLELIDANTGEVVSDFSRVHPEGVFRLELPKREPFAYRLREKAGDSVFEFDDPYRFSKVLGDVDVWLIGQGNFASLRALYAFMYTHPGKKLLFMGSEFAQEGEWSEGRSLDWYQLQDDPQRQGVRALVRDLNRLYRESPALYRADAEPGGFEWIDFSDWANVVISFLRRDPQSGAFYVVILNASGLEHHNYRVRVPQGGNYRERLNTDAWMYHGRNRGNMGIVSAQEPGAHGRPFSLELSLSPQSVLVLEPA